VNPELRIANQASKIGLSCQLGTTYCVSQENSVLIPNNKSFWFIDQARSVKMAGCVFVFLWIKKESRKKRPLSISNHHDLILPYLSKDKYAKRKVDIPVAIISNTINKHD